VPANKPKHSATSGNHAEVFAALRRILQRHEPSLRVTADKPSYYAVNMRDVVYRGKPLYFAGVRAGKNYVSYYLMPVYGNSPLKKTISPALRKRMQGKACFNFKTGPEPELLAGLQQLTAASIKLWDEKKWL
jgi:hypothetical protein